MNTKTHKILLVLAWVFVIGGIFGFIYEEIFYLIDLGHLIKRGNTFGPWIPIYAFGAILILLSTHKVRKYPVLVFIISSFVCGALEFATGLFFDKVFHVRFWDYNTEIWNWLNIDGYICLRSVVFFGISALFLQYVILPCLMWLEKKIKSKAVRIISCIPTALFITDIIAFDILK